MPSYVTPKINTAFELYVGLISQANTKIMQVSPTMAAGDVKVSTDNGTSSNITTLPVIGTNTRLLKVNLSAGEMNGANVSITFSDAAGAEWCDLVVNIQTSARQVDDLAYPATSGRSMVVDAAGLVDANTVKIGPTGSGTAQTAGDLPGRLTATRAGYLDNLSAGAAALEASLQGLITTVGASAAGIASAVWGAVTRVLTAGTNIALAKGVGVTGLNDLDAAGVRSAVGLASANLDTQLDALPTNAELATALGTADDATLTAVGLIPAAVRTNLEGGTPIPVNVEQINNTSLIGDGASVPWGPA